MKASYVGIATPKGLELLEPENDHVIRFLLRRAYGSKLTLAVCFWAVMDDVIADVVRNLMSSGRRLDALLIVQTLATETGSFCPENAEPPMLFAG